MNAFEHFGSEHTLTLIAITIVTVSGLLLLKRSSEKTVTIILRILSIVLLFGEALQDILLIRDGGNFIEFLPLHLCNLGIFVNLFASFTKGKIQRFFSEISVVLIMPGAIGALLFPDWNYRPFWSYLPLLCFLTHSLLVFIPLLLLVRNKARISFKHFWYSYIFLLFVTPLIYLLNKTAGTNYMYLMYPPKSSPLDWVLSLTGDTYYLLGLAAFVTAVLILEYALYWIAGKLTRR